MLSSIISNMCACGITIKNQKDLKTLLEYYKLQQADNNTDLPEFTEETKAVLEKLLNLGIQSYI